MCEIAALAFVDVIENHCAASVSAIQLSCEKNSMRDGAARRRGSKTRVANSESAFLATKKFLCATSPNPIGARQNRHFCESREPIRNNTTDRRDDDRSLDRPARARLRHPIDAASITAARCRATFRCRVWTSGDR
jgi:hypothetical protein